MVINRLVRIDLYLRSHSWIYSVHWVSHTRHTSCILLRSVPLWSHHRVCWPYIRSRISSCITIRLSIKLLWSIPTSYSWIRVSLSIWCLCYLARILSQIINKVLYNIFSISRILPYCIKQLLSQCRISLHDFLNYTY